AEKHCPVNGRGPTFLVPWSEPAGPAIHVLAAGFVLSDGDGPGRSGWTVHSHGRRPRRVAGHRHGSLPEPLEWAQGKAHRRRHTGGADTDLARHSVAVQAGLSGSRTELV